VKVAFLGSHGISTMTAETPRAILEQVRERRRSRDRR